jgi:hypothetical protein
VQSVKEGKKEGRKQSVSTNRNLICVNLLSLTGISMFIIILIIAIIFVK